MPDNHLDEPRLLPQSAEALDRFVAEVALEYNLPQNDNTYDAVATMILHIPATRAHVPLSFFGDGVRKQIANKYAYEKCQEFVAKRAAAQKAEEEEFKKQKQLENLTVVPDVPQVLDESSV